MAASVGKELDRLKGGKLPALQAMTWLASREEIDGVKVLAAISGGC